MSGRKKLIYGVGINDADYRIKVSETISKKGEKQKQKVIWKCIIYQLWCDMLKRCYCEKYKAKYPTYHGCTVCQEWLIFSKFRKWVVQQEWEGKELDKDILVIGNKEYSPVTCAFVDKKVNYLFLTKGACSYLRGARLKHNSWVAEASVNGKYVSKICRSEEDAHNQWKMFKLQAIESVLGLQTDMRVVAALRERIKILEHSITHNTIIWSLQEEYPYEY